MGNVIVFPQPRPPVALRLVPPIGWRVMARRAVIYAVGALSVVVAFGLGRWAFEPDYRYITVGPPQNPAYSVGQTFAPPSARLLGETGGTTGESPTHDGPSLRRTPGTDR